MPVVADYCVFCECSSVYPVASLSTATAHAGADRRTHGTRFPGRKGLFVAQDGFQEGVTLEGYLKVMDEIITKEFK